MKVLYTYIITNNISGKQYVGSKISYKKDIFNDKYIGSSKYLNEDYQNYKKANFKKKIIESGYRNIKEMLDVESRYIIKYNTLAPNGYNHFLPNTKESFHMGGVKDSQETIKRKSESHKGKKHSLETKEKMSLSRTGLTKSIETKEKLSLSRKKWLENNNHPLLGRKRPDISKNRVGSGNPMYGTCWVTNGNDNKRINKNEPVPENWRFGRILNN